MAKSDESRRLNGDHQGRTRRPRAASADAERDRYQLLLEITNAVVAELDLARLLHATSLALRRIVPHDAASLSLYDADGGYLKLHTFDLQYDSDLNDGARFPLDGSPQGLAFTTRRPVIIRKIDLKEYPAPQVEHAYNDGLRSACILPLMAHDRAFGTIDIASRSEDGFTEQDAELLLHVAGPIAIAVANALAYREIYALRARLASEKVYLEEEIKTEYNFDEFVGRSAALKAVLRQVETAAPTNAAVHIYGETGTGKELIARAIHHLSGRRERTMVKLNCAPFPPGSWNPNCSATSAARSQAQSPSASDASSSRIRARFCSTRSARFHSSCTDAKAHLIQERVDAFEHESKARIAPLQQQLANASASQKAKLEQRIAKARAEHKARSEKLHQAWELVKEAAAI